MQELSLFEELPLKNFFTCYGTVLTSPYPEPAASTPYRPILSTHLHLGLPSGLFPSGFPPISYVNYSSPPFVLHAQLI
jgi:hypothetical protein